MQFPRPHPILILGPCPENEVAFLTPSGMVSLYSSWESRLCERWAPLLHRGSWCTLPSVKFQELTRRMNHTVCDRFSSRPCTIMPDYHHIQRGGTTIIPILQMEPLRFKEHSDLPRITGEWQSQGTNLEEEADRHWDYPVSKSRRFPGGSNAPFRDPVPLHLLSHPALHLPLWCRSHWSWLSSYHPCASWLWPQALLWWRDTSAWSHNVAGSGFTCPGVQILVLPHGQSGKLVSSFPWEFHFLCKMGMIIIYLVLLWGW